ncbi:hypothetical protein [Mycobacterium shigaense]|uniref:hypothetical protein n=1 Tax=Mycobacterium shigaense TaxID=722731 RepID=UPI001F08BCC9|nr:hypothetical protein [Mycobacterium shigaense]
MTEAPEKTEPRWAELSDDVLESVETARKQAIEAARKFVDQISPVLPEQSRRKTVVDAALDLRGVGHRAHPVFPQRGAQHQ